MLVALSPVFIIKPVFPVVFVSLKIPSRGFVEVNGNVNTKLLPLPLSVILNLHCAITLSPIFV